jgi:DNA-binding transcriptional LysR family regulator
MQWTDRIGRRVKLRDLHVFLAVSQSGSMAKAASRLAVSQPVVSRTISELEHALGVQLLDRTFQGVEPTAYGRALITCGTAVFDDMRRGVQEIEFLSDPTAGELRVGGTSTLADGLIPEVLQRLVGRYPRISFNAAESDGPTLAQLLRERKIDLVISRSWGSKYGEEFAAEFLFDESLSVIVGLSSPWSQRRRVDFEELLDQPWVLPESDTGFGALIGEVFRQAGVALPTPRVVSSSMALRKQLLESGKFLTMLSASFLHFGTNRLHFKALPVTLPVESQPIEIISLRGRTPNPIVRLFIDELRILVQPLTKRVVAAVKTGRKTGSVRRRG